MPTRARPPTAVLENWGVVALFIAVVLGITWAAIVFGSIVWRSTDVEPAELATP